MRLYRLANWLATCAFLAYLTPYGKATLASAVTVAVYYALAQTILTDDATLRFAIVLAAGAAVGVIGIWPSWAVGKHSQDEDPKRVVIDEVAGQLVAVAPLPPDLLWMGAAFIGFRLFDVLKPLGIRRLESIGGGVGVMLDDLAAGALTAALLFGAYLLRAPLNSLYDWVDGIGAAVGA